MFHLFACMAWLTATASRSWLWWLRTRWMGRSSCFWNRTLWAQRLRDKTRRLRSWRKCALRSRNTRSRARRNDERQWAVACSESGELICLTTGEKVENVEAPAFPAWRHSKLHKAYNICLLIFSSMKGEEILPYLWKIYPVRLPFLIRDK